MPVLPCHSPAGLPCYAAVYSGTMEELAASCGVPGGLVLGRDTPFSQRLAGRLASASAHSSFSPKRVLPFPGAERVFCGLPPLLDWQSGRCFYRNDELAFSV